jgi:RNA polymerase sigma-70 factor (ECF subfamily)
VCSDDLWPVLCEQTADPDKKDMDTQLSLDEIENKFNLLPEKQRVVLHAIYFEGKSQQEVADALGVPIGTIKSRARLGLQRIRDMLD